MAKSNARRDRSGRSGKQRVQEFQADLEPVTAHVAATYHNAHGGSSFYVHGGDSPTKGYAVGGMKGVPEDSNESPHITPEEFQANRDRVRAANPADINAVAGTWVENNRTVFDGSTVVPTRLEAKELQKRRRERAVYNLTKGTEEDLS